MPPCARCGIENPLGRVFCSKCGSRLDLSRMGMADLVAPANAWSRYGRIAFVAGKWLVVALAIGSVALAAWPRRDPLGSSGSRSAASRVTTQLRVLRGIPSGQQLGRSFATEEINAYLDEVKAKPLGLDLVSAGMAPGVIGLRVARTLKVGVGSFKVPVAVSIDLRWKERSGSVRLSGGAVGHLPLPGLLVRPAMVWARKQLVGEDEAAVLANLREVSTAGGQLTVVCGR